MKMSSTDHWIHFKISPEDFKSVRKSEAFVVFEGKTHVKPNIDYHGTPDWWNLALLGDGLIGFACEVAPHSDFDHSFKRMFVNQERTEVFFLLQNWYNY